MAHLNETSESKMDFVGSAILDHTNDTNFSKDVYSLLLGNTNNHLISVRFRWILTQPDQIIVFVLGCMAVLMNTVTLLALSRVRSRISSYVRLIMSLTVADIIIGLTAIFYTINKVLNPSYYPGVGPWQARLRSRCIFIFIKALNSSALISTLLNLMGMALDHYVAILNPLHYPVLMSNKRKHYSIGLFWIISLLLGFSDLFSGQGANEYPYNYCERVWLSRYHEEYMIFATAFISFPVMMYFYTHIYLYIRRHQNKKSPLNIQTSKEKANQDHTKNNRKTLLTTLLILGSFILCWLPTCLFQIIMLIWVHVDASSLREKTSSLLDVDQYLFDLLLLNALLDPIIYSCRLGEVWSNMRSMLSCACCCNKRHIRSPSARSSSSWSQLSNLSHRQSALTFLTRQE